MAISAETEAFIEARRKANPSGCSTCGATKHICPDCFHIGCECARCEHELTRAVDEIVKVLDATTLVHNGVEIAKRRALIVGHEWKCSLCSASLPNMDEARHHFWFCHQIDDTTRIELRSDMKRDNAPWGL